MGQCRCVALPPPQCLLRGARPGRTPRPIIDTLNHALVTHLARADVGERLATLGMRPLASTPEELMAHIASEMIKWGAVAKDAGISVD